MRPKGSAHELENRRRLAVKRVIEGYSPAEVARFLGVNVRTVRRWLMIYRDQGEPGIAARPHHGRTPRLCAEQEQVVLGWLQRDARELGFPTNRWTAPRVAELVARTFGVYFHPRYLNTWLAARGVSLRRR